MHRHHANVRYPAVTPGRNNSGKHAVDLDDEPIVCRREPRRQRCAHRPSECVEQNALDGGSVAQMKLANDDRVRGAHLLRVLRDRKRALGRNSHDGVVGLCMGLPVEYQDIVAAAKRIERYIVRTPALPATALNDRTGAHVWLKLETRQRTGSFKDRGAANRLLALSDAERTQGVIAMSAGNHAQAVAYQGMRLGIPTTIVMPEATPFTKVRRTEQFGARIVLAGEGLAEAGTRATAIAAEEGLTLIHPYDDARVVAGQGSAGLEFLHDVPELDAVSYTH